ncbi:hypothetical protein BU24DRAFT_342511 [Aaosphaeria arxii CBS 175.79]|uniref:Gem-associated protein 5 TPR domain-containing protein n=1 Tax=Aaosphaeria arxii CBS 175.79 TaxID=1450172 RepID=A0A6A5Y1K8_9PLEO|nr:uncharacterized protein BU24DRAFT_342511 [Aaosphaeria arxii CBS 175.79]KAF2018937.1 hypothetical protein BU24DRAFT_342511 [Aaosphaeria arxii CBS 175.79]
MSTGHMARQRSASRGSSVRSNTDMKPPTPSITPGSEEFAFEPCAATASFLLYALRNVIYCLHHDTLAIERRFERHREDISWISVDNVSDRGAGRLVVSYDAGSTAIVWDLLTGEEVARFASYEQIRVASWMRNGNVAFGNAQGNVILFEPQTSEHLSARTIFDPITALAPAADCRTFAIGYLNGSILIATLQPSFTILHTLTTPRTPSPISGLAWHGSSSKQKSEMLAAQASDGDLRVWSVPKQAHSGDSPCVIRILNRSEQREPGPCWFAWSKNGRIIQYTEGQTCSWDVRTKRVTYESVPIVDSIIAITNYGPTATLFTMGRNYSIQQYDLNPSGLPSLVANIQHPPANTPPSPPNSLDEKKKAAEASSSAHPIRSTAQMLIESESSEGEGAVMSPLQRIAQEMDQLEEERRDRLAPLSPQSSRSSQSSHSSGGKRAPRYRYDRPSHGSRSVRSGHSQKTGTVFSAGQSSFAGTSRESISIRSTSSAASSRYGSSALRKEVLRSPDEAPSLKDMDLFPFTKARLSDVPYRNSNLGPARTPDTLRQNMLKVVFGWENDIDELVRDELARHAPGSAAAVLLSKWLGDSGADLMASMVGSQSMTSSDWMLLALSSMGQDSQKKVGEAFVQRLLEKGDVHPAVAILLGLGEHNDAVEVYVSRKYYMEAVLLTCLIFPTDWQRQSYLVRQWGEAAVSHGKPELALKCFSCTGVESSEPWFSPRAQDAVFSAQKQALLGSQLSPPLSPPSGPSSRVMAKMGSLKLVTDFGHGPQPQQLVPDDDEQTPMNHGVTPIAESALSPSGNRTPWGRAVNREPSSARTATPGAYRRKRMPSRNDPDRFTNNQALAALAVPDRGQRMGSAPATAVDNVGREAETLPFSMQRPAVPEAPKDVLLSAATYQAPQLKEAMPSPAAGIFENLNKRAQSREASRTRKPENLFIEMHETVEEQAPTTGYESNLSPPLTDSSMKSSKARSIDNYISSLEEANHYARTRANSKTEPRTASRTEPRTSSRTANRTRSRTREASQSSRGRGDVRYIRPAKRSPSSPVPMSPEDAGVNSVIKEAPAAEFDDERYYKDVVSPIATESVASFRTSRSRARTGLSKARSSSKTARRPESPERTTRARSRATSRPSSRRPAEDRGRSSTRGNTSAMRSPGSPEPMFREEEVEPKEDYEPVRPRHRSQSRRAAERGMSSRREREQSPDRRVPRERSVSRKAPSSLRESSRTRVNLPEPSPELFSERVPESRPQSRQSNMSARSRLTTMSRRELAQKELEERRLSLARRPSAPLIPLPGEYSLRPTLTERAYTAESPELLMATSYRDPIQRSHTADPEISKKYSPTNKLALGATSTTSVPIGLPANPRAMRHPRYMSADPSDDNDIPAVPTIPDHHIVQGAQESQDDLGPLLPSTTFGQPIGPIRSASAPPKDFSPVSTTPNMSPIYSSSRRGSLSSQRGHARLNTSPDLFPPPNYKRISPPPITASIDETISESQVVIVEADSNANVDPPLLAELQHLAGPPPPPPPPIFEHGRKGSLGVINIAIDEEPKREAQETTSPVASPVTSPPATTTSPMSHRRGRGSVSENIGMTFKRVTDRMRSTSRSRAKSPPVRQDSNIAPYESIPEFSFPRSNSAMSPIEGNNERQLNNLSPPPPPPVPQPMEQVIAPTEEEKHFYRTPREIKANMPPESLQAGAYQNYETPMI